MLLSPLETIVEYAKMVVDASRRRALIIAAEELKDRAYRGAMTGTIAEQTKQHWVVCAIEATDKNSQTAA